jgi:glycine/serine hydroxymethyltransferase
MGPAEMARIADWIADVVENVGDEARLASIAGAVKEMCDHFPAPGLPAR